MKDRSFKYFIPILLWAVIIFAGSSIPDLSAPKVMNLSLSDKLAHLTEYFIFGFAMAFGLHRSGSTRIILLLTILFGILYGASDEFHQSFVHGRSSDPFDLMADTIGSTVGAAVYLQLKKILGKNPRRPPRSPSAK